MEEAESLATRISIVVNGEMNCIGSSLRLRNTYGGGLRLEVELTAGWQQTGRLSAEDRNRCVEWVSTRLYPGAKLTEEIASNLLFHLPSASSSDLGRLFTILSGEASAQNIKTYALSQTTLDNIFALFSKRQQGAGPGE